jgi:hypothetical protein
LSFGLDDSWTFVFANANAWRNAPSDLVIGVLRYADMADSVT